MTKEKANRIKIWQQIGQLCSDYQLPVPEIHIKKIRRSYFKWKHDGSRTIITIGTKSLWGSLNDEIIHEFAHYLSHSKYGRGHLHDEHFKNALLSIVIHCYGKDNTDLYQWGIEYPSIRKWYKRKMAK